MIIAIRLWNAFLLRDHAATPFCSQSVEPLRRQRAQPVVGGTAAFGPGHVAFIAAALTFGRLLTLAAWLLVGSTGGTS